MTIKGGHTRAVIRLDGFSCRRLMLQEVAVTERMPYSPQDKLQCVLKLLGRRP
jgi:hypothetical protein